MAFGKIMEFDLNESIRVRLAPFSREDMPEFIKDGAMQTHAITRYLLRNWAPVLEDEYEWFESTRQDRSSIVWGIFVSDNGSDWQLIGNSSLNNIGDGVMRTATSGFMIFRPEWWGKGIAGKAHRARSWFAFKQTEIVMIRSSVLGPNVASAKALQSVGYVPVFTERNMKLVDGEWLHELCLQAVNPEKWAWRLWWGDDRPPKAFADSRRTSAQALEWAEQNLRLQ